MRSSTYVPSLFRSSLLYRYSWKEQRSRLVNCGYFTKIVLYDYVGGILGLTRDGSTWRLNLTQAMREGDHEIAPTGQGGAVSIEFNLLYRWHSTTSEPDAAWIEKEFKTMFPDKDLKTISVQEFVKAATSNIRRTPEDVKEWTFGGWDYFLSLSNWPRAD
jgi:linoleate 10R-lipoxygenase